MTDADVKLTENEETSLLRPVRDTAQAGPSAPRSLTEIAYTELKRRIINMSYPPSSYINEAQLCEDLGIGRTPVHQAVHRLALEGLINTIPRKGNIVSPISMEDALSVFEVRLLLEPACVRLAAERATAEDLRAMRRVLQPGHELIAERDIEALMNIDRDFHSLIAKCARNKVLEQILLRLHERSLRLWFLSLSDQPHVTQVSHEHEEIVGLLERRDGAGAERLMKTHIETARDRIRRET